MTRYHLIPITVHAGGRREPGKVASFTMNHADVAPMPHEILREHGIAVYGHDYTGHDNGRWLSVSAADFPDALRALRSYS
ncbi:MAG: hypothetical protein ACHQQR_13200 [Gemmatimonadales bacterium]